MTAGAVPAAIEVLIVEHERCRERLIQTERALQSGLKGPSGAMEMALAETEELLAFLDRQLERHIAKEEGPLFPLLKAGLPADDRLIDEMVAEHDLIRIKRDDVRAVLYELLDAHDDLRAEREVLRAALAARRPSPQMIARLIGATAAVASKLRVHFENEEELVFPLAPQLLSTGELAAVAEEMARIDAAEPGS